MKNRLISALVAIAGASGAASGQQTATYSFVFTSPGAAAGNGTANISVAPNSVVTAKMLVSFIPGIGSPWSGTGTLTGTVLGLSQGGFSITGAGNAGPGWGHPFALVAPYNAPFGKGAGMPVGQSHVGVVWVMGFLLSSVHPLPENPGTVWTGTYQTGASGLVDLSFTALVPTGVWVLQQAAPLPFEVSFTSNAGPGGSITVVPAPVGLGVLGLGALGAARRRR